MAYEFAETESMHRDAVAFIARALEDLHLNERSAGSMYTTMAAVEQCAASGRQREEMAYALLRLLADLGRGEVAHHYAAGLMWAQPSGAGRDAHVIVFNVSTGQWQLGATLGIVWAARKQAEQSALVTTRR